MAQEGAPAGLAALETSIDKSLKAGSDTAPCLNGCGKVGQKQFTCPRCYSMNIPNPVFCSQECFANNWKAHKVLFHVSPRGGRGSYVLPEGTTDPFAQTIWWEEETKETELFRYTGPLRAVYPSKEVPKRTVPAHIKRPDYADSPDGASTSELSEKKVSKKKQIKELTVEELKGTRKACSLAREVLDAAAAALKPGVTTLEIDEIVHRECVAREAYPCPLNFRLYPRSVCTSVNEVIRHGIPDARPLEDGDIISIDVSLYYDGCHGDLNDTYAVGTKTSAKSLDLISTTRECLHEAIRVIKPGALIQDFGPIMNKVAAHRGFSVNSTIFVTHGANELFYQTPDIPDLEGSQNTARGRLRAGTVFTLEVMVCTESAADVMWPDQWTAVTSDGKPSAQGEETILCTEDGFEILTAAPGWELPGRKEGIAQLFSTENAETQSASKSKKSSKKKKSKKVE